MRRLALAVLGAGAVLVLPVVAAAPASAHPLGNFTVNHYNGLRFEPSRVVDDAVVDWAEIPTAQLAGGVDADGDGRTTGVERRRHAAGRCAALAESVHLALDGTPAALAVERSAFEFRPGTAGLRTARLTCRLAATVDLGDGGTVEFRDAFEDGRPGWREVTATASGVRIDGSPVPAESISDELRSYPDDLLSSPLDVRRATFVVRPGSGASTDPGERIALPAAGLVERTIGGVTDRFNGLVGREDLTLGVGLLAVALSLALGATHALLPGHGKTVMAAYLAGRQGSARDAVVVGTTVTVTHTAGVLVLGMALTLSTSLAGDAVLGWLGVTSGALVAVVGAGLLVTALRHGHSHGSGHAAHSPAGHGHAHGSAGRHHHGRHGHGHGHGHEDGRGVSRRGLVGMGIAGGLVPSPSALVVLLAAVALGRTAFGVLLVLSYGLGMAATLTAAGLLLVGIRDRLDRTSQRRRVRPVAWVSQRWAAAVPFSTACLVIVVGLGLVLRSYGSV